MTVAAFIGIYPQTLAAEAFTSTQFLDWPRESQSFYFRTSIGMAGVIATRNNRQQAQCIDAWYFGDAGKRDAELVAAMRRFPDFHPLGVVLAMLQKACGSFDYGK